MMLGLILQKNHMLLVIYLLLAVVAEEMTKAVEVVAEAIFIQHLQQQ
jgi:hypothetical protein